MNKLEEYYYYEDRVITPATHLYRVYHADEADKVIADLEDKLQAANEQIENLINSASSIMLFQDRVNDNKCEELRHNKYKRCLAMAKWCESENYTACWYHENSERCECTEKWHNRWLELAEKFKPNKEAK